MTYTPETERLRRWRLLLGGGPCDGIGGGAGGAGAASDGASEGFGLNADDLAMDRTLEALYDADRTGGLGSSSPKIARWLGDIRTYFPSSVVRVMQQDALERLNLTQMLLQPELLETIEADVHMVSTLITLKSALSRTTRETARQVVRKVVDELMRKLANPMREAVRGSLNRAVRNYRPRLNEIDWNRTIRANLKNYQPDYRTVIPERLIGFGRRTSSLRDVILCVDQSGSMASSVVYAGIFGAVMASLPALSTRMIVFDTSVVDLTEELDDPIDLLFGTQLGGGTDINRALTYCQGLITRPQDTVLILISDMYEGGDLQEMLKRVGSIVASGVQLVGLLALSDDGSPSYDHRVTASLAALGVPAFACTPDLFPDLMAAVLNRQDIGQWAAGHDIATAEPVSI